MRAVTLGETFAGYRIESVVGRGGMGVVYRATDLSLSRPVALKLIAPEHAEEHRFRARFLRESQLAASLDHANVVPIYEAREVDGQLYLAMRFVEGSDLRTLLNRDEIDAERALAILGQVAAALDAAHRRGLAHRDVKPGNVLVDENGHAYLTDFGITRQVGHASTETERIMGTLEYLAPEQIRGEAVDGRADVYALACVLYECLAGAPPFRRETEVEVLWAHMQEEPAALRDHAALDPVIAKGLAKEREDRYATCAELIREARAALGIEPTVTVRGRRVPKGLVRRRRAVLGAGLLVLIVAVAAALLWSEGDVSVAAIDADAAALIDPASRSLSARVELDGPPSAIAAGPGAIWIAGDRDGTVSRIDPETNTIRQTITVGHGPSALAVDRTGVWAANRQEGTLSYISAATNTVTDTVSAGSPTDICLHDGKLWVSGGASGTILRLDPATHRRRTIALGANSSAVACGAGGIWTVGDPGRLMQVSPATNSVLRSVDVGAGAAAVAVGEGAVWVANALNGTITRVDPERGVVTATVSVGRSAEPVALATGDGAVWVANAHARTLAKIDPVRAVVADQLRLGNAPRALAVVGGRLWAAVAATGAGHRGGTLHVALDHDVARINVDPGTSYDPEAWTFLSLTNDGLTAFRRAGGRAGTQLVPDLAESLPAPSDGGRAYTFSVRRGVRFSTGQTVHPSDVKRGIERSRHVEPAAFGHFDGIASIAADDAAGTLVIRLKKPDPDFLYRLALPFAAAVPPGTGPAPRVVPATGPYRIATFERGRRLRLERNRYYRTWSSLAKPDGYADVIDVRMNVGADAAVEAIRAGRVDWTPVGRTATGALAALRRGNPGLARDVILMQTTWAFLNTRVPPFDDADARRAVGLAIDRRAAVAAVGGPQSARPTCSILPPSAPGYRPSCPARDLARARRLVRRSGTRGARVTLWSGTPEFDVLSPVIADALRSLGYRTRVRKLPMEEYFRAVADASKRVQIGSTSWVADYPSASTFLDSFSCRGLRATFSSNYSQYCDRRVDALMERASAAQTADPGTADALWARAERRVLDAAVAVPLLNPINVDLVSARLRNDEQSPQWGFLVDRAWVR